MKKEKKLDVVFILDKSGSMANQVENTISSFNEYLEKEKKNKWKECIQTLEPSQAGFRVWGGTEVKL